MNEDTKSKYKGNIFKINVLYVIAGFTLFFIPIAIFYYQYYGLSYFDIGLTAGIGLLATLLCEIPTGAFADLYGRKQSIVLGLLGHAISIFIFTFFSSFVPFLIASTIIGLGGAFLSGAWEAILFDSLKYNNLEKQYMKYISKQQMVFMVVLMISSLASPYLFSLNVKYPFYIGAFFSIFLWLFTYTLYEKKPKKKNTKNLIQKHLKQMKNGFTYIKNHNKIKWLIMYGTLGMTLLMVFRELIDAPYTLSKGFTIPQYGIVGFFSIIIMLIIMNFSHIFEKRLKEKLSILITFSTILVSLFLMYFTRLYLFVFVAAIFSGFTSLNGLLVSNYINHHLRKKIRATVLSIFSMTASFFTIISMILIGKFIDVISLSTTVLLIFITSFIAGLILLTIRYNKKIWKKIS